MQVEDTANTMPGNDMHCLSGATPQVSKAIQHDTAVSVPRVVPHTIPCELSFSSKRILMVEDDLSLAKLEAGVLTAQGYTVIVVHSGELALTALSTYIPDLVVLDLELQSSLNGWDILQVLPSISSTPVLITTSAVPSVRKYMRGERPLQLDYLPKPYPMQTLLRRVERLLASR